MRSGETKERTLRRSLNPLTSTGYEEKTKKQGRGEEREIAEVPLGGRGRREGKDGGKKD